MRYANALVALSASLTSMPAAAQMYGADYEQCSATTTVAITECIGQRTKVWDTRLNTAYQALTKRSDAGQRAPLKTAQRAWIQYRNANCKFYGAGEGTISRIEGAECLRAMTQQRTCEMERANNPEGKAGEGCTP